MPRSLGLPRVLGIGSHVGLTQSNKDGAVFCPSCARYEGFHLSHFRSVCVLQEIFFPREGNVWVGADGVCLGMILDLSLLSLPPSSITTLAYGFSLPVVPSLDRGDAWRVLETP